MMLLPLLALLVSSPSQAETHVARPMWNVCAGANHDNDIYAGGLGHNSFDQLYRSKFGAVKTSSGPLTIRFRTCHFDAERVRIRLWNSVEKRESFISMQWDYEATETNTGNVDYWKAVIPIPDRPNIIYYFFEVSDGYTTRYYIDDNTQTTSGGWGRYSEYWNDSQSWQITVYDKDFKVPEWSKGTTIYQIFPDRFRNGDRSNDPTPENSFIFGRHARKVPWNTPLCDPRSSSCPGQSDNQFYGGDLQGVIEKLDYLKDLGIKAIYFNPIFQASTNHRYDTQDYMNVDRNLGTNETFVQLAQEAARRGIRLILDGVLNHGSADSPVFDLYRRYSSTGACESPDSLYRGWFFFPHITKKPYDHTQPDTIYYCSGERNSNITYESWDGWFEHPVFNKENPDVRNYFFSSTDSVARTWLRLGAGGWRLDVAGDISKGEGVSPTNSYWREFRKAVKTENPDAVIISEEWGDASSLLLGREMDTTMNYRFRATLLDWLTDGCNGNGCHNNVFEDDDNNIWSHGGPLLAISETEFDGRLRAIQEDYPPEAWHSAMNLLGTHDTQRVLFVLKKTSWNDSILARRKLRFASLFQFTYPGAPTVYYGDEVGVAAEGVWFENRWRDDPYNRAVYPWADEGLHPDNDLKNHYTQLISIRNSIPALQTGSFETLVIDNARRIYAFSRTLPNSMALVILNRNNNTAHGVSIPVSGIQDGTTFTDILNGGTFVANDDLIDCGQVQPLWGRILVPNYR